MNLDRDPLRGLDGDLASQREFVSSRAPIYARVLELLPDALKAVESDLRRAWSGRTFGAWYERPLLLLAALRDDALREGPAHPLWEAIGSSDARVEGVTPAALGVALGGDRVALWQILATRALQTNDPSRAVAWLWPAALIARAGGRSLALFDVGASAGLNLVADRLSLAWTIAGGRQIPVAPLPEIHSRTGFDLRPLDVGIDADARWLRACVWPGQAQRLAQLDQAIAAFRAMRDSDSAPRVERASAGDVPARLPIARAAGPRALAYQTIVRDYLPDDERRRYEAGMGSWLGHCDPGAAVWIELEVSERARESGPAAAITAHVATGGGARTFLLAHCDPHPSELSVDRAAVRALETLFAGTP